MDNFLLKKASKILDRPQSSANVFDIDYDVFPEKTLQRDTIEENHYARLNAFRMWLLSGKGDYIRNPGFGGLIANRFNDIASVKEENESIIRDTILNAAAEQFPGITLENLTVKAKPTERRWEIQVIVVDESDSARMGLNETV